MATSVNFEIAKEVNMTVRRGDSFLLIVNVTDSAGDAVDLTAYTFNLDIRKSNDRTNRDNVVLSQAGTQPGGVAVTATTTTGELYIKGLGEFTDPIPEGEYVYDLQASGTDSSGAVTEQTWLTGEFIVNQDITDKLL
jgi:hypothetical protein